MLSIITLALFLINSDNKKYKSNREVVENVIKDVFLTENTSQKKIENYFGNQTVKVFVAMGEDSYLRYIPPTFTEKNADYMKYETTQKKYAEKVEEKILNNTSYVISEYEENDNLQFRITPWYFAQYSSDLSYLKNKLLELSNIDPELVNTNYDKYSFYEYKARVKAMEIMDRYLVNYDNKDESLDFTFYYENGEPAVNQYLSLYFNLIGITSKYNVNSDEKIKEQVTRVDKYLDEAIDKKIVDKDNALERR